MNKTKKILIAIAVLVLIVGAVVGFELLRQHIESRNMTYEQYNALSAEEQEEYFNSFKSVEDFFAWYNKAKAEYEASQDYTEIGSDGNIDIGETGKNK